MQAAFCLALYLSWSNGAREVHAVWSPREALTGESRCRTSRFWTNAIPLTVSHLKNNPWQPLANNPLALLTKSLAVQLKWLCNYGRPWWAGHFRFTTSQLGGIATISQIDKENGESWKFLGSWIVARRTWVGELEVPQERQAQCNYLFLPPQLLLSLHSLSWVQH